MNEDVKLQDGHFLPKSVYARLNILKAQRTNIKISDKKQKLYNLGRQITSYKFCTGCEKKFDQGGENYFAKIGMPPKIGVIPKLWDEIIRQALPDLGARSALQMDRVDSQKIYNFALALFWRATLAWDKISSIKIETEIKESIRLYLDKGGEYPCKAVIGVYLDTKNVRSAVAFPSMTPVGMWFSIFQLDFVLCMPSEINFLETGSIPIFYSTEEKVSEYFFKYIGEIYNNGTRNVS